MRTEPQTNNSASIEEETATREMFVGVFNNDRETKFANDHKPIYHKDGKTYVRSVYDKDVANGIKKILSMDYVEVRDGVNLKVADRIAMLTVGYVMENPSPQNVKALTDVVGDNVIKVEGNVGIEKFMEDVGVNEEENN